LTTRLASREQRAEEHELGAARLRLGRVSEVLRFMVNDRSEHEDV
jgi:hypothetical protein